MNDEKWVWKHPTEDLEINLMSFVKSICLTMDVNTICREAEEWVKARGVEVRRKGWNWNRRHPIHGRDDTANLKLKAMWERTDRCKGELRNGQGGIVLHRRGRNSGRGGPQYGISLSGTNACCMDTIIHEIAHVVHLHMFHASSVNGVRRCHDLLYNRIMLKMMQAYCGLSEMDCAPGRWGWSIGSGYAPTRKIDKVHEEMVKAQDPKIMRWFK